MLMENLYIITPAVFTVFVFIAILIPDKKVVKNEIEPNPINKTNTLDINVDFEKDFKFLLFMIEYNCTTIRDAKMIPYQRMGGNFVNDGHVGSLTEEVSIKILEEMSEDYKKLLLKYVSDIEVFVTRMVYDKFDEYAVKINRELKKKIS
ncbi:hypothetical protein Bp8pS_296 [Bacillus phage vB_BpuM-BpSp]|nr:hypothetical protein Bp8pS_296 [Bacillus phage vB_BpuM-BpSp]